MSLTADEVVSNLTHTDLPSFVVEGKDDMSFYRRLEQELGSTKASVYPCGGRDNLLKVFARRAEFSHKTVCFVADKDMWLFSGVPGDYSDIIFTEGYSIENDLYADSGIEHLLLDSTQSANHALLVRELARWFACEVRKYLEGKGFRSDAPYPHLLLPDQYTFCPVKLAQDGFIEPTPEEFASIHECYQMKLRGKLLFKVLNHCCPRGTYSGKALVGFATSLAMSKERVTRLVAEICSKLGLEHSRPLGLELS